MKVGKIAIVLNSHLYIKSNTTIYRIYLVNRTLCHFFHWRLRNPSMANCPAYVPVMVEACK